MKTRYSIIVGLVSLTACNGLADGMSNIGAQPVQKSGVARMALPTAGAVMKQSPAAKTTQTPVPPKTALPVAPNNRRMSNPAIIGGQKSGTVPGGRVNGTGMKRTP